MKTVRIKDGRKLYALLKKKLGPRAGSSWRCPFCRALGVKDSEQLDRFFLHHNTRPDIKMEGANLLRFACRQAEKYDYHDHPPVINIENLFSRVFDIEIVLDGVTWDEVDQQLRAAANMSTGRSRKVTDPKSNWTLEQVVDMWMDGADMWVKVVGISRATVNHFQLGFDGKRLTIPVPTSSRTFLRRTRHPYGSKAEADAHGVKSYYLNPAGTPSVLWINSQARGNQQSFCTIVEGDTSLFAADTLGLVPSAAGLGGNMKWHDAWSRQLYERGYTNFLIIPDNDDAGEIYLNNVIESLSRVGEELQIIPVIRVLHWGSDEEWAGCDPRDILLRHKDDTEAALRFIQQRIQWIDEDEYSEADRRRRSSEKDPAYAKHQYQFDLDYAIAECTTVDALRGDYGELRHEMEQFVDSFKRRKKKVHGKRNILLLRTPPGSGKTYETIRYIQKFAREELEKTERRINRERQRLERLEDKGKLKPEQKKRLDDIRAGRYKRLSVVFIGLYKDAWHTITEHPEYDASLWYNVEARNEENCASLDLVEEVAKHGYLPMHTLCVGEGICAHRHDCPFMKQRDSADHYPIVFLRHQHLRSKSMMKGAKLIVIDEDPSHIFLDPLRITTDDVVFFDPTLVVEDSTERARLKAFGTLLLDAIQLLGRTYRDQQDERGMLYTGVQLVEAMEELVFDDGGRYGPPTKTLRQLAQHIVNVPLKSFEEWRPRTMNQLYAAPRGQMARFLKVLAAEILADTNVNSEGFNSRISVIISAGKRFTILAFPMEVFDIPANKPVICLDATGTEHKYRLAFDAEVVPVEFNVRNPNCITTIISGKEYPMSQLAPTTMRRVAGRSGDLAPRKREEGSGENLGVFDLDQHAFPNKSIREVVEALMTVAVKHKGCLFITYKATRIWIEKFLNENYPEYYAAISFGHFGGVRGLNIFEDENAVLVAGTPRPNVATTRAHLSALFYKDKKPLESDMVRTPTRHHILPYWYSTLLPADPRTHDLVYEWEAGEIEQCVERIRPHTTTERQFVYLMTNRPACRWNGEWDEEKETYHERFFSVSKFRFMHAPLCYPEQMRRAYEKAHRLIKKGTTPDDNEETRRYLGLDKKGEQRKFEWRYYLSGFLAEEGLWPGRSIELGQWLFWHIQHMVSNGDKDIDAETTEAGRRMLKLDKKK